MKQNLGTLTPKGYNQYTDSHGRTLLYVKKTKSAYIIPKEASRKMALFTSRFALEVTVLFLLGFYTNWYYGIAAAVVIAAIFEWVYRCKFLPTLDKVDNVELPAKISTVDRMAERSLSANIVFILVALALPVLLIINMIQQIPDWQVVTHFSDINKVLLVVASIAVAGYALYSCVCGILALKKIIAKRKAKAIQK